MRRGVARRARGPAPQGLIFGSIYPHLQNLVRLFPSSIGPRGHERSSTVGTAAGGAETHACMQLSSVTNNSSDDWTVQYGTFSPWCSLTSSRASHECHLRSHRARAHRQPASCQAREAAARGGCSSTSAASGQSRSPAATTTASAIPAASPHVTKDISTETSRSILRSHSDAVGSLFAVRAN